MALWKQMSIILVLGISLDLSNSHPFGVSSLFSESASEEQTTLQSEADDATTISPISTFTEATTGSTTEFKRHQASRIEATTEKEGIFTDTTTGAATNDDIQRDRTGTRVRPVFPLFKLRGHNEHTQTSHSENNTTESSPETTEVETEQPSSSHSLHDLNKGRTHFFSQPMSDEDVATTTETETADTTSTIPVFPISPERPSFSNSVHDLNKSQKHLFSQPTSHADAVNTIEKETADTTNARPFSPISPERPSFSNSVHGLNRRKTDFFTQPISHEDAATTIVTDTPGFE